MAAQGLLWVPRCGTLALSFLLPGDSLLTQRPPFHHQHLNWGDAGRCFFMGGWCFFMGDDAAGEHRVLAHTPALPAAALFQVCCVREGESTNTRKLNMKSEFVCLPRSFGVAEWSWINKNSGYQMLDSSRNTCTVGPSQSSAGGMKGKS